jgi:hypothetical protein
MDFATHFEIGFCGIIKIDRYWNESNFELGKREWRL